MGLVIPKLRKHLCADALLRSIQDVFGQIPDHRKGDAKIPLHDALMSAFAMFSLKAPSLLAFDKERTEANLSRSKTFLHSGIVFSYGLEFQTPQV